MLFYIIPVLMTFIPSWLSTLLKQKGPIRKCPIATELWETREGPAHSINDYTVKARTFIPLPTGN